MLKMAVIGNGAGILPWPASYRKYFTRDYTPKSFSLNAPLEIINMNPQSRESYWNRNPKVFETYWNGELSRNGNNPIVYLSIANGGFNSMSFPNPGVKATLDEIIASEGTAPIRASIFGQDAPELIHIVKLAKAHKAYSCIKSFEINVSCPNTKPGECASSNDIERITSYIQAVRSETIKELIVKLSPLIDASSFIEAIINAGADAINLSNTIPGRAFNKFSKELLMPVGGVDGPIIYDRMLKNVSDTYQAMNSLSKFIPIYASGGITTKEEALNAIKAGATFIDLGYAFKNIDDVRGLINSFENYLAGFDLNALRGTALIKENPAFWNDASYWHINPDGNKQLIVYSSDHKQFNINEVVKESIDTSTIYFSENIPHSIGQYVGAMLKLNSRFEERPFTLSGSNCITVRDVGIVSHELTQLKKNDKLYIRGPLGNGLDTSKLGRTLLVGGGCGAAAIAEIPERGVNCNAILAFKKAEEMILEDRISRHCKLDIHVDEEYGGVLPVKNIDFNGYKSLVLCGPRPMMLAVAKESVSNGLMPDNIYLIMESIFKCFNNQCGACDCGGFNLCKNGPVVTYKQLMDLGTLTFRGKDGVVNAKIHL